MKNIIKYLKLSGIFLGIILFISFLFGLLNLVGVSTKITGILNVVVMMIIFLVFGIIEGVNAPKKGFVAGFKIGLIFIIMSVLVNLIFFGNIFKLSGLIYYLILILISILGSMIGINRKKKE